MSTDYTPIPVQPAKYTQPLDGDAKDVASILPFLQGLADGVASTATFPFNWSRSATTTNNLDRGAYLAADQAWFAVGHGAADYFEISLDSARTWINGATATGLTFHDVASDGVSKLVVVIEGFKTTMIVTRTAYGAYTTATHLNALNNVFTTGAIDYDAVHAKFFACYRSTSVGVFLESSPDGITFTTIVLPVTWAGIFTSEPVVTCSSLGKIIALFYDNGASLYRNVHAADGATFTAGADVAATLAATAVTHPVYEPILDEWYFAASKTVGGRATEIFRSIDDGATWTALGGGVAADMALQSIVTLAGILIGVNDDGRIFFSVDRGVTWKLAGLNSITTPATPGMRVANGQIVVWNSADKTTFSTLRYGAAGV